MKLEFNLKDLSLNFSVLNCVDDINKKKLEEEIDKIKLNDEEIINDYTINFQKNHMNLKIKLLIILIQILIL